MKYTAIVALLGAVALTSVEAKKGDNLKRRGDDDEQSDPEPDSPVSEESISEISEDSISEYDDDDIENEDVEALQHHYASRGDALGKIMYWIPSRTTMDECDTGADGHDIDEMRACVVDNSPWWAEWYIPYYFDMVYAEYDADTSDLIDGTEMDALYAEIDRRYMVKNLLRIDQYLPSAETMASAECDLDEDASLTKEEVRTCWVADMSYWRSYYFDYYFDPVFAWFDADEDDALSADELAALYDEVARIMAMSKLMRINQYLPAEEDLAACDVDADGLSKDDLGDCWKANMPYWKQYYFPRYYDPVWSYFDADASDVLEEGEITALYAAAEERVLAPPPP